MVELVRRIDNSGRIVISKKIRNSMNLHNGCLCAISATKERIYMVTRIVIGNARNRGKFVHEGSYWDRELQEYARVKLDFIEGMIERWSEVGGKDIYRVGNKI